jgi:hypothetical protein
LGWRKANGNNKASLFRGSGDVTPSPTVRRLWKAVFLGVLPSFFSKEWADGQ